MDCVHTTRSLLACALLLDITDIDRSYVAHTFLDCSHDGLIVNFASMPLEFDWLSVLLSGELNAPERLWNELFNFFGLVYTETKSWSLTWPVGNSNFITCSGWFMSASPTAPTSTTTPTRAPIFAGQAFLELNCLESGKGHTYLEV